MGFHMSLASPKRVSPQATDQSLRRTISDRKQLVALLLILLAALLAVWLVGPETMLIAGEAGTVVPSRSTAGEALTVAVGAPEGNQFPNPESWYEGSSPYAHEPLVISSGGGSMNLPK
jgi:hypothetical protein